MKLSLIGLALLGCAQLSAMTKSKPRSRSQDFADMKLAAAERENFDYAKLEDVLGETCEETFKPYIEAHKARAKRPQNEDSRSDSYKQYKKPATVGLVLGAAGFFGKHYKDHKRFVPESMLATIGTIKSIKWFLGGTATVCVLWYAKSSMHKSCRLKRRVLEERHQREMNDLKEKMNGKLKALGQTIDGRAERLAREIQTQDLKLSKIKTAQEEEVRVREQELEKIRKAQAAFEQQMSRMTQVSEATLTVQEATVEVITDLKKSFETYNAELAKAGEISERQKEIITTITSLKAALPRIKDAVTHLHAQAKPPKRSWTDRLLGRNKPKKAPAGGPDAKRNQEAKLSAATQGAGPKAEAASGDAKRSAAAKKEAGSAEAKQSAATTKEGEKSPKSA